MNISEPFIRRPVMTTLVMAAILFFGIIAYKSLPVSDLPNVDYPTIQVQVSNPGSNPTTMANTCATPLEREFMTIDGINSITSNSSMGKTNIVLQFNLTKSMDSASIDVTAAINRAEPNLPEDLPNNPTYRKVNPSATPILYMAITSNSMSLAQLHEYADTYIGKRISMIDGVSQVITYGAPYAARIQVNPEQLAAMNLGLDEVADAIQKGNVDIPTGKLYSNTNEFTLDVDGQLMNGEGYKELVIKTQDGSLVKIAQIGKAFDSLQNDKYYLHYKSKNVDEKTVVLAVQRQPGENTIQVINSINELLPTITKQLPASLKYYRIFDKSEVITDAVNDVKLTLIIAFVLVVFIIYFSLGKLLNTLIPSLALPMSIIGTFSIMYLLGFSIDILSLLALTLSIGFLVDDAIVVLENNVRFTQMGHSVFDSALLGSKQISITIFSMTACLISVFIPMLFLGGIVGRLFSEFAITIVVAVLISGIISLTLTPLLSSRFIAKYTEEKKGMEKFSDKINEKLLNLYKKTLTKIFNYKKTTLCIGIFCIFGSLYLYTTLPKEFLPDQDESFLQGFSESQDGTSPHQMAKYQQDVADILMDDPAVDILVVVAANSTDNEGEMFVKLKPYSQRGNINIVINRLMKKLYPIAGVNTYLSTVPLISLQVGTQAKALYQYALTSLDQDQLNKYSVELESKIKALSGFTQVSSDLQVKQPQLNFHILRDRASDLNINANDIEKMLLLAYSNKKISTINSPTNQYDVIMETLPKYYKNPSVISSLYVRSSTNRLIPLEEIVKYDESIGPLSVNHLNGLPSAMLSFNLQNIALSDAIEDLENAAKDTLPPTISAKVQGTADVFKQSFANLTFLIIITIFVIYIILGILYESFIHPITVMSTLPPATFGGLLMLFIFRDTISLYSFVGLIMLIGIVMKNGIMMVDFANENIKKENASIYDAIFNACMVRFRPIMMTTLSAFMGAIPIALGIGGSSAFGRRPLGIVIVGGLVFSQILTLYLTPVIYFYLEELQEKIKNRKKAKV